MRNMEVGKRFAHKGRFGNDLGAIGVAYEGVAPLVVAFQPQNFHRNLPVDVLLKKKNNHMYLYVYCLVS